MPIVHRRRGAATARAQAADAPGLGFPGGILERLDGVVVERGDKDDAGQGIEHGHQLHAAELGHLDIEKPHVGFEPLNKQVIRKIVDIQWREIQKRLSESNIEIEATTEVLDYLGEVGFDPNFGARPLKRTMQRLILNELSKQILAGYIKNDSAVLVDLDADKQVYFKNIDATVEV